MFYVSAKTVRGFVFYGVAMYPKVPGVDPYNS